MRIGLVVYFQFIFLSLTLCGNSSEAYASALWGNRSAHVLYPIDVANGNIGDSVTLDSEDLPSFSSGDLAGERKSQGPLVWAISTGNVLTSQNPLTLQVETITQLDTPETILSLAIDPVSGEFYGSSSSSLYRILPETGGTILVGATMLPVDKALGFDLQGNLYGVGNANQLVSIDKTNGDTSLIATLEINRMEDIAVRPETGIMYGLGYGPSSYELFHIDLTDGSLTVVGNSLVRPTGLAFAAIPEPASGLLLVFAGICYCVRRCRFSYQVASCA